MATLVIDPGHGGKAKVGGSSHNNARGPGGTLEKNVNLAVALATGEILRARGHQVLLTRTTDVNLGLRARAMIAADARASAFVSVHFNACREKDAGMAQGTETYVHTDRYTPSSARLASCLQNSLVAALLYPDRGTKRKDLGVVNSGNHHPDTAAALVEVSFMDRADEEQRLQSTEHQDKVATAIADGVALYWSRSDEWGATRYHPEAEKGFMFALRQFLPLFGRDQDH